MKVGFVSQETQDFLYEVLCRDNTFPWFYQEFTSKYTEGNSEVCKIMGYEEHPYFAHIMAHDGEPKSAAYEGVFKKLWDEIDPTGTQPIIRARAAKSMINDWHTPPTQPHVDAPFPHHVMIYYCNDSDGPTILYNQKYTGETVTSVTPKQYIEPEKGKYLIFDGLTYHSGSAPRKNTHRTILNINFYGHPRVLSS